MSTGRVVVIGGGPAGLAAAAVLARGGVEATVLEAGSYPRARLCGEFLSPDALSSLHRLGEEGLPRRLRAPRLAAVRLTSSDRGRTVADVTRALPAAGWGVSRHDFDAALAGAARRYGVDVREGVRVHGVSCDDDAVVTVASDGERIADAAVVATGRLGRPRGAVEPDRRARRAWHAVKLHVSGVALSAVTELHFVRGAYVGLNEVSCSGERRVNVCALATSAVWRVAGATADGLLEFIARESPGFAARLESARPIHGTRVAVAAFDFDRRGSAAGGVARPCLVVGDASAAIAPLAGDGQAMALAGGVSVADLLVTARDARGALTSEAVRSASGAWQHRSRRAFGRRLATGALLQRALLRPLGARLLIGAAGLAASVPHALYRVTRGPLRDEEPAVTGPSGASRGRSS